MDNIETQQVTLEGVSRRILGDYYYDEILRFLEPHLSDKTQETYTLFLTRRCSCLADIFLRIFNKTHLQNNTLLTNSAFINLAKEIARKYKNREYENITSPFLFMIDDSISFGRATTSVLTEFKSELMKYTNESENTIDSFLRKFLRIRVYMKKDQRDLLTPFQRSITEMVRIEPQAKWNDFSTRVSELISNADVANAAFVYSAGTNELPKSAPDGWTMVKTIYSGHTQHTYFRAFPNENNPIAICSIRYIPCSVNVKYRAVPFFFLPDIEERQIAKLEKPIFSHLKEVDPIIFSDERYKTFSQTYTLRSRAEFVTMYLGQMILMEFAGACSPELRFDPKLYDTEKVNWTYTFFGDLSAWNGKFPQVLIGAHDATLDVSQILLNALEGEQYNYRKASDEKSFPKYGDALAEYLFDLSVEYEKQTQDIISKNRYLEEGQGAGCDSARRISVVEFLKEASEWIKGCFGLNPISTFDFLAYTLQMMDAGLMSVVTRIKDELIGCQQIRVCEQAMCVKARKYYAHIDVLNDLSYGYDWAGIEIYKTIVDVRFRPILKNYLNRIKEKHVVTDFNVETELEKLCFFLLDLKFCYQKVENWTIGIVRRFCLKEQDDNRILLDFYTGSDDTNNEQWKERHLCFKEYLASLS